MRLKNRLSLAVSAVSSAALVASFMSVYVLVRRDETRDLDRALLAQAHTTAEHALARSPDRPEVTDGSAAVPENINPLPRYIAVYDAHGGLVSATRSFGDAPPSLSSLGLPLPLPSEGVAVNLAAHGVPLRGVALPIGAHGHVLLYATLRRSIDEDLQFLFRLLSFLFVAGTLVTSLVARWVGSRLASDVHAIATVARAVSQGDLKARVGPGVRSSAETRALAGDLDHMVEQLGALVEAQRTFVSHAAHELRSPLATIRGELQLALRRPREAEEYRTMIEEVLADVETLVRLAEDLLTLARVQSGSSERAESSNASEIVIDALRMAKGPAESRGVQLGAVTKGNGPTTVRGRRSELARALRNLVDNAIAHSPSGGAVAVEVARRDDRVEISVTDQGTGVSSADQSQIFAPFFRGSKDRGEGGEGAGLGLAIARGIARAHGGDVYLDTKHLGGARFVLQLPSEDA